MNNDFAQCTGFQDAVLGIVGILLLVLPEIYNYSFSNMAIPRWIKGMEKKSFFFKDFSCSNNCFFLEHQGAALIYSCNSLAVLMLSSESIRYGVRRVFAEAEAEAEAKAKAEAKAEAEAEAKAVVVALDLF
uniref:Anoctamin n=1 Tax=Syphacia muris TaxID=451379 RepID=A0A0N5AH00_9BILA